jgi:hypothetical protein
VAAIRAARDQATAENTLAAVMKWLDQPRTLIKGGESNDGVTFCQVGKAVLKVCSQSLTGDLVYNVARNVVTCSRDRVTVSIAPATEGDLLDALESVKGSARLRVQEFLRIVRDEPAQPLEITIVNASAIGKVDKVITVKRDDSGKLTGAVVQAVP